MGWLLKIFFHRIAIIINRKNSAKKKNQSFYVSPLSFLQTNKKVSCQNEQGTAILLGSEI